jgi:hypothetical protein
MLSRFSRLVITSFFIFYFLMIVLTWNCRGAQGIFFQSALKNFYRNNNMDLVALQKPRCSGLVARRIINVWALKTLLSRKREVSLVVFGIK